MPDENMTADEAAHRRALAEQARREMVSERQACNPPEGFGQEPDPEEIERLREEILRVERERAEAGQDAYDLTGDAEQQGEQEQAEDDKHLVEVAFLVFTDPKTGRAIATSDDLEGTLARLKVLREASLIDMRRYCAEVVEDVRLALQTQSLMGAQMQMMRQVQEQAQTQQVAAQLDLSKMRSRG